MHVVSILQKILSAGCASVHKVRLCSVLDAVNGLLRSRTLSLTAIGRDMSTNCAAKHAIKRVDRLLGNVHLQAELPLFYRALNRLVLNTTSRPIILVDWSDVPTGAHHCLLRAALPVKGRAITVYEEIHPLAQLSSPTVERDFVRQLRAQLPANCRPILVTDAGFAGPWFQSVQSWQWDVIGRVRNTSMKYQFKRNDWRSVAYFIRLCSHKNRCFGLQTLCKSRTYEGRLVGVKKDKDVWLLFTSLSSATHSAKQIISMYQLRMHIEEAFRDLKSTHYGLDWRASRCNNIERLRVLLLLAMLASFALYLIALLAIEAKQHLTLQANSIKSRNVLSVFSIGYWALRKEFTYTADDFERATKALIDLVACVD